MVQLQKTYDPDQVEEKWVQFWQDNGLYQADENADGEHFSMAIPPPNITGSLHIGHAFNNTLQDILARWNRMRGRNTLWQPGTDHAGIATQNVIERQLHAEGTDRKTLGREEFIKRIWKWRDESGGTIKKQLVRLGASLDWNRERFTMDDGLSRAVREVFVTLYEEGLIYRGDYIINWCPRCLTALSDLEVEFQDKKGSLCHIKYPFKDGGGHLTIATTRPETLLGDTAVAVNPDDGRHRGRAGKILILPVLNREIPVIEDSYVDMEFGSGALKVTPAHDPNDFEIGLRHNLPTVNILNPDATMNDNAGPYEGMDRFACRKALVAELEKLDLLEKVEDLDHSVGHCYRCKTVVEPYISRQWFVKADVLAKPAIEAVRDGSVKIIPKFWENTYFEWMENIRPWCISRQIWWGHQIPAWTCSQCQKLTVTREDPTACGHCGGQNLERESDVLDTWFSSALWPFSTLGWPDKTKSLEKYYPTSVMCTGFDILFFWVARMIMMGLKFTGEVPFHTVYIHALVRDAEGLKMSKSKGNVVDPLEMMKAYGTDALRFTLAAFAAQGRDIKLDPDRIEGYRNFCNKLWNASRFAFLNLEDYQGKCRLENKGDRSLADRWILSRLNSVCAEVNKSLDSFRFNDAAGAIYKFIWNEFCDWYIELSKSSLLSDDGRKPVSQNVLAHVLETSLRLLHPFMPFITEEIWQQLPREGKSIMTAPYPVFDPAMVDKEAENKLGLIMKTITGIRNIRGEMDIKPSLKFNVLVKTADQEKEKIIKNNLQYIMELARVEELTIGPSVAKPPASAAAVLQGMEIIVPLEGLMDFAEEKKRVEKVLKKIEKDIAFLEKKLSNPNFVDKAPAEVIEKDRQKQKTLTEKRAKLLDNLLTLKQAVSS